MGNPNASPAEAFTANSQVQPQLAADPANQLQLTGVWEQDRWNAIGARTIEFTVSADGGSTWISPSPLPFSKCASSSGPGASYDRSSDPSVAVGNGGIIFAGALAFSAANFEAAGGTSAVLVTRSTDGGKTWQTPVAAIADTGTATAAYFNDRDAIAADPNSLHVYLLWDRSDSAAGTKPTWLAHSGDGGVTWDRSRIIYDPGSPIGTFNNQPLVMPNGNVVDIFTQEGFGYQLTAISSANNGATWTTPAAAVIIANMTPVAAFFGTNNPISGGKPIRDSSFMAQTAVDPSTGTLAAVWQESSFSGNLYDGIALSLSSDGGLTWSVPIQVNTTAPAVAAFNPTVHFSGNRTLAVTYFDFRNYQSPSTVLTTNVWLREFTVSGTTVVPTAANDSLLFGPFDLNNAPPADQTAGQTGNALFLGDQQGLSWNGSGWVALFSASPSSAGARVFSATAP